MTPGFPTNRVDRVEPLLAPASAPAVEAFANRQAHAAGRVTATVRAEAATTGDNPAATTGGGLTAAYAEFVVDPSSQGVRIRIIESESGTVIREIPSAEVQHAAEVMRAYAEKAAQHRARTAADQQA